MTKDTEKKRGISAAAVTIWTTMKLARTRRRSCVLPPSGP